MKFNLTQDEVTKRIVGNDLTTYDGWLAAALALLSTAPDWTAIVEKGGACFVVKTTVDGEPYISSAPGFVDPNHVYTVDDLSDFDSGAWCERGCWDGVDSVAENMQTLSSPDFVSLRHAQP